uniref:Uncharacterized protein n=1 Tax=Romanomermis culicivorax TaxID=13658 RepID=A0A915K4S0_ROMCU
MLSAFRKKFAKGPSDLPLNDNTSSNSKSVLPSIIDPTLRKKFARGVQYNLRILIKGDRNVGKTCLFNRLQGKSFVDGYLPTDQIQAASIQWNYKATDDVIKVDVWDVVDKSRTKRKIVDGLKLNNHIHE